MLRSGPVRRLRKLSLTQEALLDELARDARWRVPGKVGRDLEDRDSSRQRALELRSQMTEKARGRSDDELSGALRTNESRGAVRHLPGESAVELVLMTLHALVQ